MTAMWKSSSQTVFQLPWRNSRHHRNALRLVSTSTWSGRFSSLQCSSVSGWTCKAFSVTSRPSDMDGEEETPLINFVFIFFCSIKDKCNVEANLRATPRATELVQRYNCDAGTIVFVFLGTPKNDSRRQSVFVFVSFFLVSLFIRSATCRRSFGCAVSLREQLSKAPSAGDEWIKYEQRAPLQRGRSHLGPTLHSLVVSDTTLRHQNICGDGFTAYRTW